jgi:hypothetical protein
MTLDVASNLPQEGYDGIEVDPEDLITVWYDDNGISVENAKRLWVATFVLTAESGVPEFEGLNGFSILADKLESDGWHVAITCHDQCGNGNGFTSDGVKGILSITNATGVEVVKMKFAGITEGDKKVFYGSGVGKTDPPVYEPFISEKFDLNSDGAIDLLDLVAALGYYKVNSNDAAWEVAKYANFSASSDLTQKVEEINVTDFIFLLNKMQW